MSRQLARVPAADRALLDPAALSAGLEAGGNPRELLRRALESADATLKERFQAGAPAPDLVHRRAWLMDQLLVCAWRTVTDGTAANLALVAVGGYGRGELHPGSDIDLMVLLGAGARADCREALERFITLLWDIGLEVGHSARSVADCVREAEQDITVATNLMEARRLAGPEELFLCMRHSVGPDRIWPSRRFFEAKLREQIARHKKYNDTAYNLEPNIKEGPGGLRDIQMVGWVAKRHFNANTLHDLVTHGFLTEQECADLVAGQNFLWRIRIGLHTLAGRREDRLLFDHQRTLAQQFGYRDNGHRLAVEQFMKGYYRTVKELSRLNEMLLQLFQEVILYADEAGAPRPINKRFQARRGFLEVAHEKVFTRYPFALLEVFLLLQQHPELKGVRAATIRLIRAHLYLIDDAFRADLRCRSLFMEIMRQPTGITHELRRMNRYGVLAAYVPMFGNIVGQMQHDLFHVYTVDEHSLFVLRNVRRLTVPEFAHEFPYCSKLIQRLPKPEILYLAALFHDIAKGRGGDHSELGAADARAFCRHHGMSEYDAKFVAWLVRHHLIMSMTAQREDISDPDVVNAFAAKVAEPTRLDYLYLLTVADIRGTSPTLWNSWKDALLLELYQSARYALRHGLDNPMGHSEIIEEKQAEARRVLGIHDVGDDAVDALWQDLHDDYFLRYSVDEIVWHGLGIIGSAPADRPLVLIRTPTERGGTEVFIYTHAEHHLFAVITRALDRLGLNIVDARIITSRSGFTLDTYIVLEGDGAAINNAYRLQEILATLKECLAHPEVQASGPSLRVPRQLKHFPIATRVLFSTDVRNQRTIMEVTTGDRPGLLSQIAQALVECGIKLHNAKIATFGERAEDIFYLTDDDNRPLGSAAQLSALKETVVRYLEAGSEQIG